MAKGIVDIDRKAAIIGDLHADLLAEPLRDSLKHPLHREQSQSEADQVRKAESSYEPLGELQELPATAEDFAYSQSIAIPDPESIATRELTVAELPEARLPRGMSRQDILFPSEQRSEERRVGKAVRSLVTRED